MHVQPLGNGLFVSEPMAVRNRGLGAIARLSDRLLIGIFGLLDAESLVRVCRVSKAFYVFSGLDELHRYLVLRLYEGDFRFCSDWSTTLVSMMGGSPNPRSPIAIEGFFSDEIFHRWLCTQRLPKSIRDARSDSIERISGKTTSIEEFRKRFEIPSRPVILTDLVQEWPAAQKWTREFLENVVG